MRPSSRALCAFLPFLCLPGCCSISQGLSALFCGPTEAPWAEKSRLTPMLALKVFLGAAARDDPKTIYYCLSDDLKTRWGIGLLEFAIAWERLKEEVPGIHIAYQATISAPPRHPPTRITYTLTLAGHDIEVMLRRYDYWKVTTLPEDTDEPGEPPRSDSTRLIEDGRYVPTLEAYFELREAEDSTPIRIKKDLVPGVEIPGTDAAEILEITLGREWLIYDFRVVEGERGAARMAMPSGPR